MMTNNLPVYALAPLEYRLGLDAACTWLATKPPLCLRCDQPVLLPEVEQRLDHTLLPPWSSGLWLEPQLTGWQFALTEFSAYLPSKAPLAVLLSLPFARCLPGNQCWPGVPLGKQRGGLKQFVRSLNECIVLNCTVCMACIVPRQSC
jgi:hypothetical protein